MDIIEHSLDNSDDNKEVDVDMLNKELVTAQPLTIIEEETSLSPDDSGAITQSLIDNGDEEEITYQLRSAAGVTYRLVSVESDDLSDSLPQFISTNGTTFSSPSTQTQGVYVLNSSPDEVFTQNNQRYVPRATQNLQIESVRGATSSPQCRPRDDRRRATHNEVERRRRDKINNWIMKLSKIIPECSQDTGKGGFETQSKGGILAKACDYIMELRTCNQRLVDCGKENEQLASDLDNMMRQVEELRNENNQLRAQLVEHGISPCIDDPLSIT